MKSFKKRTLLLTVLVLCLIGISMLALSVEAVEYTTDAEAKEAGAVARIGDTVGGELDKVYFKSLAEAINAAENGDTVYLLTDIALNTVSITDNSVTIEGVGDVTISKSTGVAFKLLGDAASLALKNIKFSEYTNVIYIGEDKASARGDYDILLENVDMNFAASGALYSYNVKSLDVTVIGGSFTSTTSGAAIVNVGGTYKPTTAVVNTYITDDVTLSGVAEKHSSASTLINVHHPKRYDSDAAAIAEGMVARTTATEGGLVYYGDLASAIKAAQNGGTVYLFDSVTPNKIEIKDYAVTIVGVGDNVAINNYAANKPTFVMLGSTASLTVNNIDFEGYDGANVVIMGLESDSTKFGVYNLVLDGVDVDYRATGAFYFYNAETVNIDISNSSFTGSSGNAIAFAGTIAKNVILNMSITNVERSEGVVEVAESNITEGREIVTIKYGTDADAVKAGAVARIGAQRLGSIGDVYYTGLSEAIAAAQDGDTVYLIDNETVDSTIEINGKSITVEGVGNMTVTGPSETVPAFKLLGDTATLALKNLTLEGYDNAKVVVIGEDQDTPAGEYTLILNGVTNSYNVFDAIYYYNVNKLDIIISDSSFTGDSGKVVINSGGADETEPVGAVVNVSLTNVTLNGVEAYYTAKGNIAVTYTTDADAIRAGAVARISSTVGGKIGELYYTSLKDAITNVPNGGTVYLLTDTMIESTITIEDRRVTIEGVIANKGATINRHSTSTITAFKLLGNTASLTIRNVTFAGYASTNVIVFGEDKSTRVGNYELVLDSVEMTYSASGALYFYNVESVDIHILYSKFNGASGNAIINSGNSGNITKANKVEMYLTGVVKSEGVEDVHSGNKGTVNVHSPNNYNSDTAAITAGMVARTTATEGGAVYYNELALAIKAAQNGGTVYLIADVTANKIGITNYAVNIEGVGNVTINRYSQGTPAFALAGSTASLSLKNIIFAGYTSTNVIFIGSDSSTRSGDYTIELDGVDMTYSASGALYYFNASTVDITVKDSSFNGASGNGIINSGGSNAPADTIVNLSITNVTRSSGVEDKHSSAKGTITITYTTDADAIRMGAVARLGDVGGEFDKDYFKTLDAAINVANGETVYLLTDITLNTISITDKSVSIEGVGDVSINRYAKGVPAFNLLGDEAYLSVKNVAFEGYTDTNVIVFGTNPSGGKGDYDLLLDGVDMTFRASGALYYYDVSSVDITIKNSSFTSSKSGDAIINSGGSAVTKATIVNVSFNNVIRAEGVGENNDYRATVTTRYETDADAVRAGAIARLGDVGGVFGEVYYTSFTDAISKVGVDNTVYLLTNITPNTIEVSNKTLIIEGVLAIQQMRSAVGKVTISKPGANVPAFKLLGDSASLTLKNVNFDGYSGANVIVLGTDSKTANGDYDLVLDDVNVNFAASSAIYYYNVESINITINGSRFNGRNNGTDAIINSGGTNKPENAVVNMALNKVAMNGVVETYRDMSGMITNTYTGTYATVEEAVAAGALYRLGDATDAGEFGVNYFTQLERLFKYVVEEELTEIEVYVLTSGKTDITFVTLKDVKMTLESIGEAQQTVTLCSNYENPVFMLDNNSHLVIKNVKILMNRKFIDIIAEDKTATVKLDLEANAEIINEDFSTGYFLRSSANALLTINLKTGSSIKLLSAGKTSGAYQGMFDFTSSTNCVANGSKITVDGTVIYGLTFVQTAADAERRAAMFKHGDRELDLDFKANADIQLLHVNASTSVWNSIVCVDSEYYSTRVTFNGGKYKTTENCCLLGFNGDIFAGTYTVTGNVDFSEMGSALIYDYAAANSDNTAKIIFEDVDLGTADVALYNRLASIQLINVGFASDEHAAQNYGVRLDDRYYSLNLAIERAQNGDTITLTYDVVGTNVEIKNKTLTIKSADPNNPVTITNGGVGASYIFKCVGNTHLTLENLKINAKGRAISFTPDTNSEGFIDVTSSSLTLINTDIYGIATGINQGDMILVGNGLKNHNFDLYIDADSSVGYLDDDTVTGSTDYRVIFYNASVTGDIVIDGDVYAYVYFADAPVAQHMIRIGNSDSHTFTGNFVIRGTTSLTHKVVFPTGQESTAPSAYAIYVNGETAWVFAANDADITTDYTNAHYKNNGKVGFDGAGGEYVTTYTDGDVALQGTLYYYNISVLFDFLDDNECKENRIVIATPSGSNYGIIYDHTTYNDGTSYGYDYKGAKEIAEVLTYHTAGQTITFYPDTSLFGKELIVGIANRDFVQTYLSQLAMNEYAIVITEAHIMILAWHNAALNEAIEDFISALIVDNNTVYLPNAEGIFKAVASDEWITVSEKPAGTLWGGQYMGDDSLQYVYSGYDSADDGKAAFNAYCAELESEGYVLVWENSIENNLFCLYKHEGKGIALYVAYNDFGYKDKYYGTNGLYEQEESDKIGVNSTTDLSDDYFENRDNQKVIRVISMPLDSLSIPDTEVNTPDYSYKKVTDTFVTTLSLRSSAVGMGYVYMLEDGSFLIVDGGGFGYANSGDRTEAQAIWDVINKMYEKAHGHTPTQDEPIHISAWYLTHAHGDHFGAFEHFMTEFGAQVTIDYAIVNLPVHESFFWNAEIQRSHADIQNDLNKAKGGKRTVTKVQTGQVLYIANLELEVLMTYGDHAPFHITTTNDTNTVIRFKIHNKDALNGVTSEVLYLGDSWRHSSRFLCEMYDTYLQTEIVQLAHHGNIGSERVLYKAIAPRAVFFPHDAESFKGYVYFNIIIGGNAAQDVAYRYAANVWCATNAEYVWSAPYGTYNVLEFKAARPYYEGVYDLFTGTALSSNDYDTSYSRTNSDSNQRNYIHNVNKGYKSVNIVWGDLSFTYQDPDSVGTWNPETHVYDGWTANGDNRIFVGNASTGTNQTVNVAVNFAAADGYEYFIGIISDDGAVMLDSMDTKLFTFVLKSATLPDSSLDAAAIGSITVTFS